MAKQRQLGDPWHTVLYREPHTLWWALPLVVFAVLLVARRFLAQEAWLASVLFAAIVSAVCLLVTSVRRRSRSHR